MVMKRLIVPARQQDPDLGVDRRRGDRDRNRAKYQFALLEGFAGLQVDINQHPIVAELVAAVAGVQQDKIGQLFGGRRPAPTAGIDR